jgi:hypothetical protein
LVCELTASSIGMYEGVNSFQTIISMEETQTLCTEEIEIKTDMEVPSCSSEKDEKADTR